jgi:hypothetical protein
MQAEGQDEKHVLKAVTSSLLDDRRARSGCDQHHDCARDLTHTGAAYEMRKGAARA